MLVQPKTWFPSNEIQKSPNPSNDPLCLHRYFLWHLGIRHHYLLNASACHAYFALYTRVSLCWQNGGTGLIQMASAHHLAYKLETWNKSNCKPPPLDLRTIQCGESGDCKTMLVLQFAIIMYSGRQTIRIRGNQNGSPCFVYLSPSFWYPFLFCKGFFVHFFGESKQPIAVNLS